MTSKNHNWLESSNENQRDAVIEFNWENEWVLIHSNESYCAGLSCVAIYYVARGGSLGDILLKAAENCFPVVFTLLSKTVLQCELAFKWKLSVPVQRSLKVYPVWKKIDYMMVLLLCIVISTERRCMHHSGSWLNTNSVKLLTLKEKQISKAISKYEHRFCKWLNAAVKFLIHPNFDLKR